MAHFAQLDENNLVTQVIVVNNEVIQDLPFPESEPIGVEFCQSLFGSKTLWKQASYNGTFRKRFPLIEFSYNGSLDAFIKPKPIQYPSFVLDSETADWVPPLPRPTDTVYKWDEPTISWIVVSQPYPSWTAQGDPLQWVPPVPRPNDNKPYKWDEDTLSWIEVTPA